MTLNPYDSIAEEYDDLFVGNVFYDNVTAQEESVLDEYVRVATRAASAIDIGCGTGDYTRWLAQRGYHSIGLDLSKRMCELAVRQSRGFDSADLRFVVADARRVDEVGGNVDVAVCLGSTLNHIHDWRAVIEAVGRSLRPEGIFVFSFDSIFGIDSFFWLLKRKRSGYSPRTGVARFVRNLACVLNRRAFYNDWTMKTPAGVEVGLKLTYEPFSAIKHHLENNGLSIAHSRGVNFATCFVPEVLDASTDLTKVGRGLGARIALALDRRISPRVPTSWSANCIVVARKRR